MLPLNYLLTNHIYKQDLVLDNCFVVQANGYNWKKDWEYGLLGQKTEICVLKALKPDKKPHWNVKEKNRPVEEPMDITFDMPAPQTAPEVRSQPKRKQRATKIMEINVKKKIDLYRVNLKRGVLWYHSYFQFTMDSSNKVYNTWL